VASPQYAYKKPSSFNLVSLLMLLAVLAGGYWAAKFGPVYWNRYKVDEILRDEAAKASSINVMNADAKEQLETQILASARERVAGRGVPDPVVYFDAGYRNLHADYEVVVKHPGGKTTLVRMRRKEAVP
jgi:hypothetical protein